MKKIIAAAVATAFVAPVMAAEVTIGGDVEYRIKSSNSATTGAVGDSDIKVSASEDLGNGLSANVYLVNGSNASTFASALTISGDFGSVQAGNDNDPAIAMFDDKSDVAPTGAGDDAELGFQDGVNHFSLTPNLGVDGLQVAVSFSTEDGSDTSSNPTTYLVNPIDSDGSETAISYAVQYSTGGFAISYGMADLDSTLTTRANPTAVSMSYAMGPIYVGYDAHNNYNTIKDAEMSSIGATYNYGPGKIFYETMNYSTVASGAVTAGAADQEETAYGVSYSIGAVGLYVESQSTGSDGDDTTTLGVTYGF
jgi:hypothetical protein